MTIDPDLAQGIVRVGDGRGFVVEAKHSRLVITAAHCLPRFPPPVSIANWHEHTYWELLGPLGGQTLVSCELMFADPIADVAVLDEPESQELADENDAYHTLLDDRPSFQVADPAGEFTDAWLLSLDGEWQPCTVRHVADDHPFALQTGLWIEEAPGGISGGMSGSPILALSGAAIGVVSTGTNAPTPRLTHALPGGLLRHLVL